MKFVSSFCLFILILLAGYGQNMAIEGSVIEGPNGKAISFATVFQKGTTNGTYTDKSGNFSLEINSIPCSLVVRFLGFAEKEILIEEKGRVQIELLPIDIELGEELITAMGIKRELKALGYSLQKLDSKEISEVSSVNFIDNLSGRAAGVSVTQGATGPGSSSKITIRGEASFTNNNPLFVVDGIPINNNSVMNYTNDAASGFQEVDFGNGAMNVNPDDVESVTILKGPGAAALYGSRASNGAIIITTKDGTKSQGLGITFSSSTFIDRPFKLPEFQNKYGQGNSGQFEYVDGLGGGTNDNISYSWGPKLDEGLLIPQYDSPVTMADGQTVRGGDVAVHGGLPITPTPFKSNPNNLKSFYKTGFTTQNSISLSHGSKKGSFRLSFSDLRNNSIIPGVNFDRNTVSGRFSFNPNSKLKVFSVINYINSRSDNRPSGGYGSENINYASVAWGPRSLNFEPMKEYWQPGLNGIQQYSFNYTYFDNPYFTLFENRNSFSKDRLMGKMGASYELTDGLSLSFESAMDYHSDNREFRRQFSTNRFKNGAFAQNSILFRENNTNLRLNYQKIIGPFSLDVYIGGNRMDQINSRTQIQALTLAQPGVFSLSNAASPLEAFEYRGKKRINSLFGIAKLGYDDFLFIDITGRNDWSSSLASPSMNTGTSFFYPSISASYIITNHFLTKSFLSDAKLRLSLAQVGNDTEPFQTSEAFIHQTPYGGMPSFGSQDMLTNSTLQPEKSTSLEGGLNVGFWNNRMGIDLTGYHAITTNQIISLPVPISSGFSQQIVNGGKVSTKGLELILHATPIQSDNFRWTTSINFSRYVSRVLELPDEIDRLTLGYSRVYDNENQTVWIQVKEGGKIGDMYGTGYQRNENGDFVLDENGKYIVNNDLIYLGNYNPDYMLGFQNSFSYKNWDFNFLFDWRQGGKLVSRTLSLAAVGGQLIETENRPEEGFIIDGVINTGTEASPIWEKNTTPVSAETYYRQYYDRNHEENNTYNASFLKFRQFALGYTFSPFKIGKNKTSDHNIKLSFVGRNLLAFSKMRHFDPEQMAVQGQQFVSGVEDMSYASTRSLGFKLTYTF